MVRSADLDFIARAQAYLPDSVFLAIVMEMQIHARMALEFVL